LSWSWFWRISHRNGLLLGVFILAYSYLPLPLVEGCPEVLFWMCTNLAAPSLLLLFFSILPFLLFPFLLPLYAPRVCHNYFVPDLQSFLFSCLFSPASACFQPHSREFAISSWPLTSVTRQKWRISNAIKLVESTILHNSHHQTIIFRCTTRYMLRYWRNGNQKLW